MSFLMFGPSGYTTEESNRMLLKALGYILLVPVCIVGMLSNTFTFYFGLFCGCFILFCGCIILVRFLLKKDGTD